MRSVYLYLLSCLFIVSLQAQTAHPVQLKGIVGDSSDGKVLAVATVILQDAATHTRVKSTVTTDKGLFQIAVPAREGVSYELAISHVGYLNQVIAIPPGGSGPAADLGTLLLARSSEHLKEVTIAATRPLVKQEIDRLTYDVQADPQSKGQTAMDMLRHVPLITVDGDDNIELQGSGSYRIFINGKPSALVASNPKDVLRAMPANLIQRIEVITTPPAKYESEGLAGIINIITVKKTQDGYTATVSARESIPFGPGLNFSTTVKEGKFGISAFGGGGMRPAASYDISNFRQTKSTTADIFTQNGPTSTEAHFLFGGMESSYEFDSLNLLTASLNVNAGRNSSSFNRQSDYSIGGTTLQSYDLLTSGLTHYHGSDVGLNYQLGFRHKKEQLLTASYRYSSSFNDLANNVTSTNRVNYEQPDNNQQNKVLFGEHTVQVDYTEPFRAVTMEAGVKAIFRNNSSDADGQLLMPSGYVENPAMKNDFRYEQDIYSAYNSYNVKWKKWALQGGFRVEHTQVNADFISSGTTLSTQYTNFVPTLSIQKNLKNNNSLTFGITNRLQRPYIQQLNPFVDRSNPQIVTTGNPELQPVISHLFELSYNHVTRGNLNVRLSYMYTNNSIETVTKVIADTLSQVTYGNVGQSKIARFNISGNYPLTPKWSINFNTGVFYVWITGTYNGQFYSNQGPRTNTFANMSYKLGKDWVASVSGGYNRRYINLQGSSNDYVYSTLSLTKTLGSFTMTAVLNNPFASNYLFTTYTDTPDFYQSTTSNLLYRNVTFNLSYKFGRLNNSIRKNKHGINNDDATPSSN